MNDRRDRSTTARWLVGGVAGVLALVVLGFVVVAGIVALPPLPNERSARAGHEADAVTRPVADEAAAATRQPAALLDTEPTRVLLPLPRSTEPCTLRVDVQRWLGQRRQHYTGPLRVLADGQVLLQPTLVNSQPLALELPAGLDVVRFEADDHEPAELAVVEAAAKRDRRSKVALRPQTVVLLRVAGWPERADSQLHWSAATEHDDQVVMHHEGPGLADEGLVVPCVPGAAFSWQAELQHGSRCLRLQGHEPALQPRERRVLTLDAAAVATQRYRVVGPSAELLPYLSLQRSWQQGEEQVSDAVTLDGEGVCDVVAVPGAAWRAGRTDLLETAHGDEIWLRPATPLFGVGLVDEAGKARASGGCDAAGEPLGRNEVHVLPRSVAVGTCLVDADGRCTLREADLATGHDLVWLSGSTQGTEPGRIVVRVTGPAPAATRGLHLVVGNEDGHEVKQASAEVEFTIHAGATVDVAWSVSSGRRLDIARREVTPGQTVTITTEWPAIEVWHGVVEGLAARPVERRWNRASWGEGWPFGKGLVPLGAKDHFEFVLLAGETLPSDWRLWWGSQAVPAQLDVDAGQRRFVVREQSAVRWVPIRVQSPARWSLLVGGSAKDVMPLAFARRDNEYPLPVAAGQAVHGAVTTGAWGASSRTIAWWSVVDGVDALQIVPAAGRTLEVRPRAAKRHRAVALVGPNGQRDWGCELETDQARRLFVPEGTRGLAVFEGNDVVGTLREIPLGSDDVVVID